MYPFLSKGSEILMYKPLVQALTMVYTLNAREFVNFQEKSQDQLSSIAVISTSSVISETNLKFWLSTRSILNITAVPFVNRQHVPISNSIIPPTTTGITTGNVKAGNGGDSINGGQGGNGGDGINGGTGGDGGDGINGGTGGDGGDGVNGGIGGDGGQGINGGVGGKGGTAIEGASGSIRNGTISVPGNDDGNGGGGDSTIITLASSSLRPTSTRQGSYNFHFVGFLADIKLQFRRAITIFN
ncbi:hypothetical protein L218DRAFT_949513 [Marasmius fiardii PR-910]|nr:hypothetical protein L218DRAFT_949513 [Marasmius fiardii PR-910]